MTTRCLGIALTVLSFVLAVAAQNKIDEYGVIHPTPESLAANQRMAELLRNPSFVTLRLAYSDTLGRPTETPRSFKVGDEIDFQLMISHSLLEPLSFWQTLNPFENTRLELLKAGDLVTYSRKAQENVERTETRPSEGSGAPTELQPGREYELKRIRLKDWYKPLGPGHYQLSVGRRFTLNGEWVQSSSITFDVEP